MCDLFHEAVPFEYIAGVFGHMHRSKHTFILLTKRAARMKEFIEWFQKEWLGPFASAWPREYPTVWLGVTAENQVRANERIPILLNTPASHRWISCGPLLGPIKLRKLDLGNGLFMDALDNANVRIEKVIVEGESGLKARPMDGQWVSSLKLQCGSDFWFKQYSDNGYNHGQVLDGIDYAKIKAFNVVLE
jgi:protein gp37